MLIEKAKQSVENINKLGKAEGIDFKYDTCRVGNTFKAHRLAKYIILSFIVHLNSNR